MITKIRIVGIGIRKSGVNPDTKKPYAFTPIHYTRPDGYVNGLAAESCNLDDETLAHCPVEIDKEYLAVTHKANYRYYVDAILGEA